MARRTPRSGLRALSREELLERLEVEGAEWQEPEMTEVLANPFTDHGVIQRVLARRELLSNYRLKRAIALHPRTPLAEALRLVPHLRWHDLVSGGKDPKLQPLVRRSCDRYLLDRMTELALGERISVARSCGRSILLELRFRAEPEVFASLLDNPRLTEDDLVGAIVTRRTSSECLQLVARHRKWSFRTEIRLALVRNPDTPPASSVGLMSALRKDELLAIWRNEELSPLLRQSAHALLERDFERRRRPRSDEGNPG